MLLVALILFLNSGFLYTHTTAATINGQSYSPAELNYYYANQYNAFVKQYGNYAGIFGLDTSSGLAGAVFPIKIPDEMPYRTISMVYDPEYPQSIASTAFRKFMLDRPYNR